MHLDHAQEKYMLLQKILRDKKISDDKTGTEKVVREFLKKKDQKKSYLQAKLQNQNFQH